MKIWVRPSRSRRESNSWLRKHCGNIKGDVLSIGSGADHDGQGDHYRNYFKMSNSYTTSEVTADFNCDLTLDIRSMPQIKNETYDCIYCSGVLEHVDNYMAGLDELTRILKTNGVLLLGLPFRQAIHMWPQDFWRFTEFGIKKMLESTYEILEVAKMDVKKGVEFPAAYWVKAVKIKDR